jgi:predicted NBD/HSP70 family sugar kinase
MNKIIGIDIGGTKCAVSLGLVKNENEILILGKEVYQTRDYP